LTQLSTLSSDAVALTSGSTIALALQSLSIILLALMPLVTLLRLPVSLSATQFPSAILAHPQATTSGYQVSK